MHKSITFMAIISSLMLTNYTVSACTPTLPSAALKEFKVQLKGTNAPHQFSFQGNSYTPVDIQQFKAFEPFNGTLVLLKSTTTHNFCAYGLSDKDKHANHDREFVNHEVDVYVVPTKTLHKENRHP